MRSFRNKWLIFPCAALALTALAGTDGTSPKNQTRTDFEARTCKCTRHAIDSLLSDYGKEADEMRRYMEFQYAYMPLPDILNQTPEFFAKNVEAALRARREMPWGDSVPEREFRHFVVPVRINNEDLDSARLVFQRELFPRVKNLSMKDAILEVNHWCHEKVTYQPSDSRTSSPLSALSQAIGRCGEESTFTVAALRSVGIPARQVYTPRWAHTDDNHAWVEAWADGKWWFIGACEPEAILNLAWFNSPASRGMLMNTKVLGDYDGPEEVLDRNAVFTEINVTSNYAPVEEVAVRVVDQSGKPVEGANVNFSLYNYAEYFAIARKKTDSNGIATLTCGKGDLVVWASDGNRFGVGKVSFKDEGPVEIRLDMDSGFNGVREFDLVPPAASATLPSPTPEQSALNEVRKSQEDSIRRAYTSTFATPEKATSFAAETVCDAADIRKILTESRGNHLNIVQALRDMDQNQQRRAVATLLAVSEKDRRDIPMEVLWDALETPEIKSPLYNAYVLNPRVEAEGLRPYKKFFRDAIDSNIQENVRQNPGVWEEWTAKNIAVDSVWNPTGLRINPVAVWKKRIADPKSRSIFFVATLRSMGVPARIDPVTGKTQWAEGTEWHDADFDKYTVSAATADKSSRKGTAVDLSFTPVGRIVDPGYYTHFTVSRIDNGLPRLLEYDEQGTLNGIRKAGTEFDDGQYVLTTGQRLADGSVLARSQWFTVASGKTDPQPVPLTIRQQPSSVQVIGNFNSENIYHDAGKDSDKSLLSTTGRGYYTLILATPNHEPTSHVLNEISALARGFEEDGRKVMLIYRDEEAMRRADVANRFPNLPKNVVVGADIDGRIFSELYDGMRVDGAESPVVAVADTFNRVVYLTSGYTIGTGDRLLDILHKVRN